MIGQCYQYLIICSLLMSELGNKGFPQYCH